MRSSSEQRGARGGPAPFDWLLVLAAACALYLPYLGATEIDNEEGRRAIPAREMLASGDYVLPTIWGRPYLSKPPLYFWAVAATARMTGGVNELATRLPAVLSTIATALALLWLGARAFGRRAGVLAALFWCLMFSVFEKGALGELEATLAFTVLLATGWLADAARGSWTAALVSGLALAAALLTKGPPALLFFAAAALSIAWADRRGRHLRAPQLWVALATGVLLAGVWVAVLLQRPEAAGAIERWQSQMDRREATDALAWLGRRATFPLDVLAGFLPASLLLVIYARSPSMRTLRRDPTFRAAIGIMVLGMLALLLTNAVQHRYAYPLAPWCALAAGALLDRVLADGAGRAADLRLRVAALPFLLVGPTLLVGAGVLLVRPVERLGPVNGLGWMLALAGAAAGLFALARWKRAGAGTLALACLAVIAALRLEQVTQLVPQAAERRMRRANARIIDAALQPGEPLHVVAQSHWPLLFYLQRPVVQVDSPDEVPGGSGLLLLDPQADDERDFVRLEQTELARGERAVVLRRTLLER